MSDVLRVGVIQNDAGTDMAANLAAVEDLMGCLGVCDLVVLPEVFALRGGDQRQRDAAQSVPGPLTDTISAWARSRKAFILAGSIHEEDGGSVFNTSLLFDRTGKITARFRKIHLFERHIDGEPEISESAVFSPGDRPVTADIEGWSSGLTLCYDLRFPELFREYAGSDIIFCPANFTKITGEAHWELLVRARAVENQCFVVAPNQCGTNPGSSVESYGNSMIVDPWGTVLARAGAEPCVMEVELRREAIARARRAVPALTHRRL